jgi:heavy metal translocating P-type ATPase
MLGRYGRGRRARQLVIASRGARVTRTTGRRGSRVTLAALVAELRAALRGDERARLVRDLDAAADGTGERAHTGPTDTVVAAGAVGLGLLAPLSPWFYLAGSAVVVYVARALFSVIAADLRRGRLVTAQTITLVVVVGMLLSGHLVAAAIGALGAGLVSKLILRAESASHGRLIDVFSARPSSVWVAHNGVESQVPFDTLEPGDIVLVHAGEVIPVDGSVVEGAASVDQHLLTGEGQPVDRGPGEPVLAATLVCAGRIGVRVETAGEATVAAGIGRLLEQTRNYSDTLVLRGRRIADRLMPFELGAGLGTMALLGPSAGLGVLWSGLGYRMIALAPISVLNYLQILSRRGILIKDGRVLEALGKVDTVVFDKTGTLTLEQPTLCRVHCFSALDEDALLRLAAGAEHRQSHPVARAILKLAQARGLEPALPDAASYQVGFGIRVQIEGRLVRVGSLRFMRREGLAPPAGVQAVAAEMRDRGHSLVCIGVDDAVAGMLELAPSIRPEARALIAWLHGRGIRTCIISGDHEAPTRQVAGQLGVEYYFADTLPEHKADHIRRLRDEGRFVCFVGDGINDAVALKSAQVSISLEGASSAATDTAQVIFMDGTLAPMRMLFQTCDALERTMRGNLALSIVPGVINIAGIYLLHFTLPLSMALFYTGTLAGLANSILPLVRHQGDAAPPADGQLAQARTD